MEPEAPEIPTTSRSIRRLLTIDYRDGTLYDIVSQYFRAKNKWGACQLCRRPTIPPYLPGLSRVFPPVSSAPTLFPTTTSAKRQVASGVIGVASGTYWALTGHRPATTTTA